MREEEPGPRGNPAAALLPPAAPGNPAEPSALPAHAAYGTLDHPVSPADAAPPPRGFRQLQAPPAARLHGFPDVQPPQAPAPDARPPRLAAQLPPPTFPPQLLGPASHPPAPEAAPRLFQGVVRRRPPAPGVRVPLQTSGGATRPPGRSAGPRVIPPRRRQAPLAPATSYLLSSPRLPSVGSDPQDG
ncbi:proline-rich protein 2-like [Pongo pygmaeus]|uniref:proline-rich protein 2-like n=1 Tax=Pongo pygmaeus TaxID=9600 RepID=UPI00300BFBCE